MSTLYGAPGSAAHAEGSQTIAGGDASHAEGSQTSAFGLGSHSEGYQTTAQGDSSHAEGDNSSSDGENSHAEGQSTSASANAAHAEGSYTIASQQSAHSEGNYTTASGSNSHAEGYGSRSTNDSAHSEGNYTTASGQFSHTEGTYTTASANAAHAEGRYSDASGEHSHAEGDSTIAQNAHSHAAGSFNVGTELDTIHETGIGTNDYDRRNAFEIYNDGRIIAPELDTSLINSSKSLITKEYLNMALGSSSLPSSSKSNILYNNGSEWVSTTSRGANVGDTIAWDGNEWVIGAPQSPDTFKVVDTLPAASTELFEKIRYSIEDSAMFVCVANVTNPTSDSDCFWLQR